MKFFKISYLSFIVTSLVSIAKAEETKLNQIQKNSASYAKQIVESEMDDGKDKVNALMTVFMLGGYNVTMINNLCADEILKHCGKYNKKNDKANCIALKENRLKVKSESCLRAIKDAVGTIPTEEDIAFRDIIIPKGSKIEDSYNSLIKNVKFKEPFVYDGITYSPGISVSLRKEGYIIASGHTKQIFEYEGQMYKSSDPYSMLEFTPEGKILERRNIEPYIADGYTIPAGSNISFNDKYVKSFKILKDAKIGGIKFKKYTKFYINYDIREDLNRGHKFTISMPYHQHIIIDDIKYTGSIKLDENFNVKSGVLAENSIINNKEYKIFSIVSFKDNNIDIIGRDLPRLYIEKGTKIVSHEPLFVTSGKSRYDKSEKKDNGRYKLSSVQNRLYSTIHPYMATKFENFLPKNIEFTVEEDFISNYDNNILKLVDENGTKYEHYLNNVDELEEIFLPYKVYSSKHRNILNMLKDCSNNKIFKCKVQLKPYIFTEKNRFINRSKDSKEGYPYSKQMIEKSLNKLVKYFKENDISYKQLDEFDNQVEVKLTYKQLGDLIFDSNLYGLDIEESRQKNSIIFID